MAATSSSSPSSLTLRARDEIGIVSVGAVIIVVVVVVLARAFAPSPSPRRADAGKRARGARDTESMGSIRGNAGVERPPSPLATTRRGGEEEENKEPRDRRRVSLCRSSRRARARASDHPSIATARASERSVVPNVRSFHHRSPRCRTYGEFEDVGRCYRVREWCFSIDRIRLNGIRTQNHLRATFGYTVSLGDGVDTPGGLTTSGDSRKSISTTRTRKSRARGDAYSRDRAPQASRGGGLGKIEKISSRVRRGKGDRPVARARAIAIARASSWVRARWAGWTRWTGWGGRSRMRTRSSRARRRRRRRR